MSIKVAIRVRPFNQRESKMKTELCVQMAGNSTILKNEEGKERTFAFDYSFWSHDGFEEQPNGQLVSTGDKYADQDIVFNKVGQEILENAWAGYHCCLFAYGQTGAGKSYSIIGYGPNKGIVPRSAEEIFVRINKSKSPDKLFEVTVSMMEIYNEKVHDLLMPNSYAKEGGLKIRENKTMGVYVEDLSKWPVQSYEDISAKIDEGNRNRTIASTALNATSSRAHTIISIELRQIDKSSDKAMSKHSIIYLVDLAGSERVYKSDIKADRLKESCAINKSLSALGKVISVLAERETVKGRNMVVPYRDAVLTRILQNALGGNSKTLMICAISPAMDNYDETLSTLRYADQAKKIKCNAVVNESETDKIIRLLKEENEKLRVQLQGANTPGMSSTHNKEIEEQLTSNQSLIDGLMKPFEERVREMKAKMNNDQVYDYSAPHLININEDMLLSGKIFFNLLAIPILYIGRKNGKPKPHVVLNGPGIEAKHARIMNNDGRIFLVPQSAECRHIYVNGKIYPGHEHESETKDVEEKSLDWEFFTTELSKHNEGLFAPSVPQSNIEDEMNKLKSNYELQYEKAKIEIEQRMNQQKEEYEEKLKMLESNTRNDTSGMGDQSFDEYVKQVQKENTMKEHEFERERKRVFEMEKVIKRRKIVMKKLEKKLSKVNSMVSELNLMSQELNRRIKFYLDIGPCYLEDDSVLYTMSDMIRVKVINDEVNHMFFWDMNKLNDRYFLIREVLDKYFETEILEKVEKEHDPFWDPEEPIDVGRAFISLKPLSLLFDSEKTLKVYHETEVIGDVFVRLEPCDQYGQPLKEDDVMSIVDPMQLLGTNVSFSVQIKKANMNQFYTRNCFFQYKLNHDSFANKEFKTPKVQSDHSNIDFDYFEIHCLESLDQSGLIFLTESRVGDI